MLKVLLESPEYRVLDKPSGLSVLKDNTGQPSVGDLYPSEFGEPPLFVHRIDKGTSGALLIARTEAAQANFQRAFAKGEIEKVYLARVESATPERQGTISLPLEKARKGKFRVATVGGLAARTDYEVIAEMESGALLAVYPKTGRTHQIRIHLAAIGSPLAEDPLYGTVRHRPSLAPHLTLHAWKIRFTDPTTANRIEVIAPPPDWAEIGNP